MDPEGTPETPAAGSEPSDDDILAAMADERLKKSDDKLLGDDDEKPAKVGKGKAKPAPKEPESDDDEDDDASDDDDSDDESADDDDDEAPRGNRAKALARFNKGDVKGALKLALGLKDEDFEASGEWEDPKFANAKFRVFRKKEEKAKEAARERDRKHSDREAKFTDYVKGLGVKLQPAFNVMKLRADYQKTRDPAIVVQLVEEFTEEGYDIVQKRVLKGEKAAPTDRRLLSQLEAMKAELAELKKPKEETPEEKQVKAQAELKEYLGEIKDEIAEHDVRKIPGATKKVYRMLRKHYDPALKAPKISIEKAADRVLKLHLRTLARLRPETETEEKGKKPAKVFAHSRTETREAAVTDDDPSDDDILRQMEVERARKRREEAKKAKGGKR